VGILKRIPAAALPQLVSDFLHLSGAISVTVCVTILAFYGKIPADITGAVYTGVIGYVAGRAGNVPRATPTRMGDPPSHDAMDVH
jgi:hypothetical protein